MFPKKCDFEYALKNIQIMLICCFSVPGINGDTFLCDVSCKRILFIQSFLVIIDQGNKNSKCTNKLVNKNIIQFQNN